MCLFKIVHFCQVPTRKNIPYEIVPIIKINPKTTKKTLLIISISINVVIIKTLVHKLVTFSLHLNRPCHFHQVVGVDLVLEIQLESRMKAQHCY